MASVGSSQSLISADCITNTFGFDLRQGQVAREAWALSDCIEAWDRLRLRLAYNGTVMQEDGVDGLMRPEALLDLAAQAAPRPAEGRMIFSGTIASSGVYPPGPHDIDIRLEDPAADGRMIRHTFRIKMLFPLWA